MDPNKRVAELLEKEAEAEARRMRNGYMASLACIGGGLILLVSVMWNLIMAVDPAQLPWYLLAIALAGLGNWIKPSGISSVPVSPELAQALKEADEYNLAQRGQEEQDEQGS